jgi:hypothetical protein
LLRKPGQLLPANAKEGFPLGLPFLRRSGDRSGAPKKKGLRPFFFILAQARIHVDLSVAISGYNPSRFQTSVVSDA